MNTKSVLKTFKKLEPESDARYSNISVTVTIHW